MALGTIVAALVGCFCCAHDEQVIEVERLRHPVTGELLRATKYLRCTDCWRRTPGWVTTGGVQAADAPTRWIRR